VEVGCTRNATAAPVRGAAFGAHVFDAHLKNDLDGGQTGKLERADFLLAPKKRRRVGFAWVFYWTNRCRCYGGARGLLKGFVW
jgi:hypothetical protein